MHDLRPKQIEPIQWGWKNKRDTSGNLWVVEPLGNIIIPDNFISAFDFSTPTLVSMPKLQTMRMCKTCSTSMKSIFTTASRFIGVEEALIQLYSGTLEIEKIVAAFIEWNIKLLDRWAFAIDVLIVGDEIGSTKGLTISPTTYKEKLAPWHKMFVDLGKVYNIQVWYHSDGDVSEAIPIIKDIGFKGIHYQDCGNMQRTLTEQSFPGYPVDWSDL